MYIPTSPTNSPTSPAYYPSPTAAAAATASRAPTVPERKPQKLRPYYIPQSPNSQRETEPLLFERDSESDTDADNRVQDAWKAIVGVVVSERRTGKQFVVAEYLPQRVVSEYFPLRTRTSLSHARSVVHYDIPSFYNITVGYIRVYEYTSDAHPNPKEEIIAVHHYHTDAVDGVATRLANGAWRVTYAKYPLLCPPDTHTPQNITEAVYAGQLDVQTGLPHGTGVMNVLTPSVCVYTGDWQNGTIHGNGTFYHEWSMYQGKFKHGKCHGHCVYKGTSILYESDVDSVASDNDEAEWESNSFVGDWKDGQLHGKGKFSFGDGSYYEGHYQDDARHGTGVMTEANGSVYEGEWVADARHGTGVMTEANGSVYEGEWQDSKPHGAGQLTENGDTYKVSFTNGIQHAECVLISKANGKRVLSPRSDDTNLVSQSSSKKMCVR